MLTVKTVRPDKSEFTEEATSAALNTAAQSSSGRPSVSYFILSPDKEQRCVDVFEGTVYVMNSAGKTVANYFLGNAPENETQPNA